MNWRILFALAVIPGIFLAVMIYRMDKIEKEPPALIIKLMLFGIISTIPAAICEQLFGTVLGWFTTSGSLPNRLIENFIIIACAEEGFKFLLLKLGSWKSKEFNFRFDAVVYAVAVSIGFAVFENVLYVFEYGFANAIVRALTAVPAHTIFAISMGFYYGLARYYANIGNVELRKRYMRLSILVPAFVHGLYDFLCGYENYISMLIFFVFIITLEIYTYKKVKAFAIEDRSIKEM